MRKAAIAFGVVIALGAVGLWIMSRETTLIRAANYLVERFGGRLQLTEVSGSLLSNIRVRELRLEDKFGKLAIDDAQLEWKPLRLLLGQVGIGAVAANTATIELAKSAERPKPPQSLAPPISIAIRDLYLDTLSITRDGTTHTLRGVRAELAANASAWDVKLNSLATKWGDVRADIKIAAREPFGIDGSVTIEGAKAPEYVANVKLAGTLLNVEASADAKVGGGSGNAKLFLAPYDTQPLTLLQFAAKDIDPRAWSPGAPTAKFGAEANVKAGADRKLSGTVSLNNADTGTIDEKKVPFARASAALQGDLRDLAISDVKLDFADAGQLAGNGAWRDGRFTIPLDTRNLNLRGAHKRLNKTQLAGRVAFAGGAKSLEMQFNLREKPYQFRFAGVVADAIAKVDEAYARAGNAQLTARGSIALDKIKPFNARGTLTAFDPSQFGKYMKANINGRFQLKGQVSPVFQVAADLRMIDSQLFGRPASVNGTLRSRSIEGPDVAVDLTARLGDTQATVKGTLLDPTKVRTLDAQLTVAGATLAELYPIFGLPLPPTPPYRVQGRLLRRDQLWEFKQFAGVVGDSDISGDFSVDRAVKPQLIRADLTSQRLDLADLAGMVGAEKSPTGKATTPNPARVLPERPYSIEKLKSANADVRFQGKQIMTQKLPVQNMSTHLVLKNGVLTLAPLNFGVADGTIVSNITLDGSTGVIASRADIRVKSLQMGKLMPQTKMTKASVGEIDGRLKLAARGNSIATMLGSANGDATLLVGEGEVSDLLMRLSNLDVANALLLLMRGDRNIPINCLVADMGVENGVMRPRQFVMDTLRATLVGDGTVNFQDETLDLKLVSKPKGKSLLALRGPILVRGTFAHPSALPDFKRLTARAGAAAALALVATPFAALVPFIDLGGAPDAPCAPLVAAAQKTMDQPAPAARR